MRPALSSILASLVALTCAGWPVIAAAQSPPAAPAPPPTVSVPSSPGQRAMVVGLLPAPGGAAFFARTCAALPCAPLDAKPLAFKPPPDPAILAQAHLSVLRIAADRHVVLVDAGQGASRWQALVAAPVGNGTEPIVIWSGATPPLPPEGADAADAVQVTDPAPDGTVHVLIGQIRPGIELCGRPSLLSPRLVFPLDLSLKHVKLQRLSQRDRDGAIRIQASPVTSPQPAPLAQLLAPQGASSAVGSPLAVADGNPETSWSEARGGEGRGEFVTLRAPSEVPITSLTFTFRPPSAMIPHGAAPSRFWVATSDALFDVSVPEDGWKVAGSQFEVRFPEPVRTACVALVLGEAYVGRDNHDVQVTVSEVSARSEWDGTTDLEGLAAALAGGGERARSAAQVLMRGGEPAHKAALQGYAQLDEAGRQLALDVLDSASCELASPLYASLLADRSDRTRTRSQDRIRRCGKRAAPALTAVLDRGPGCTDGYLNPKLCESAGQRPGHLGRGRLAAARELASVAPLTAIEHLVPILGLADAPSRASIRASLARAGRHEAGQHALARLLTEAPPAMSLDLLRAVQDSFAQMPYAAATAFARIAASHNDDRTRFLLCEPAAALATLGHDPAAKYLHERILHDPSPMIRWHAVELSAPVQALHPSIAYALEDANMRVRAAAAVALRSDASAAPYLVRRLMIDDWPLVRAEAARALAHGGGGTAADDALAVALTDPSPTVRAAALGALGERGAAAHASEVRSRAEDSAEPVAVRLQAVRALGSMCDRDAVATLTIFARRSADANSPEAASGLGRAAIVALGRLHPADLQERLAPLLHGDRIPAQVRAAAESALHENDVCRPPAPGRR